MKRKLQEGMCYDVLITTGGVSMGELDLVKPTLIALGATVHFGRIAVKPGKPTTFATTPRGGLVFGLAGNPVSALLMTRVLVLPALARVSGRNVESVGYVPVTLRHSVTLDPREEFARGQVDRVGSVLSARVAGGQQSSRLGSMVCNALIRLPPATSLHPMLPEGSVVDALLLSM